jgi:hypothetical protein
LTGTLVTSCPAMLMLPESGSSRPAIKRSKVDLPEPEGPSNEVTLPSGATNDTPPTAATSSRELNDLTRFVASTVMRGFRWDER